MRLSTRQLNRTLLRRQHLLCRVDQTPAAMAAHLVGLQAQDVMSPYLSLNARLEPFDPYAVSRALDDRSLVRLMTMRGTLHLLTPDDALMLRPWTQVVMDRVQRNHETPLPQLTRPLVQAPPRGSWKKPGGVHYEPLEEWVGARLRQPDVRDLVRRYLRAFGPASTADITAWSGVTRLGPVVQEMDDLVHHEDAAGKVVHDVAEGVIEDGESPAPARLLGTYDNLWLSHAGRDRVTEPAKRKRWMGPNGGAAMTLFVDGMLEGLWRIEDGRVRVLQVFRELTRREQSELDDEVSRVEGLLAR